MPTITKKTAAKKIEKSVKAPAASGGDKKAATKKVASQAAVVVDGVELKEGETYYVIRNRGRCFTSPPADYRVNPVDMVKAKFLSLTEDGVAVFDDGRLAKEELYLFVEEVDQLSRLVFPLSKSAEALSSEKEIGAYYKAEYAADDVRRYGLLAGVLKAGGKIPDSGVSTDDLNWVCIAMGGDPAVVFKGLKQFPEKKREALVTLRSKLKNRDALLREAESKLKRLSPVTAKPVEAKSTKTTKSKKAA